MKDNYREILRRYWHYDDFRGIQLDIIESIGQGRDTLGLMPTGGGKSITFQVPALASEGLCLVVTPLIALMKDQVENLRRRGIKAAAIYSGMTNDKILMTLENCIFGAYKLLYVSPERLTSEFFIAKIRHARISFITVDEAHCITQWGYDFRPSYLKIALFRKLFPDTPVLALTATATPAVIEDIQVQLGFKEKNVFRMSFLRVNLAYMVFHAANRLEDIRTLLNKVGGSSIVYVQKRKDCDELVDYLTQNGISATSYHARLNDVDKNQRQEAWKRGDITTMVATNAFGMGIDKPDVRLVIHKNSPASLEAYFQEAGRAGRDGKKAYAVMLYNDDDRKRLLMQLRHSFPEKDFIRQVYNELAYFYQIAVGDGYNCNFEFDINKFCRTYRHMPEDTLSAIKILMQSGYVAYTENDDYASRVMFALERDDLYRLRNNSQKEDLLIETMLRKYPGLFCTWTFINEADLASILGMEQREVYLLLKGLDDKNILNYIPQKHIPHLRFTQRREDGHRIIIPKEVYEVMYMKAAERIDAVLKYAQDASTCRSRQLLAYFGETKKEDCGVCDVCSAKKPQEKKTEKWMEAYDMVMAKLADKKRHDIAELCDTDIPLETVADVITYLTHQQTIGNDGIYVFMK